MAEKAVIAMSGGVDSSVAALLVKDAGYETIGVTMRLVDNADLPPDGVPENARTCCSLDDVTDARAVAHRLGMPFYVFNFVEDFRAQVMARFTEAYCRGETPNPCIDCNRYMKFEKLMHRAKEIGCSVMATGHYARVERAGGRWLLKKGVDGSKDQSYVLWTLTQQQLSNLLLPLGSLTKVQVRQIAEENGFINADKKDSQDICFVPDGDYAGFIERRTGQHFAPGDFVGLGGEHYGAHKGIIHYTVGQRKGLGLSFEKPMYVCAIDAENNQVVLGPHEALFSRTLRAAGLNLIAADRLDHPTRVCAKIRYRQQEQPAEVIQTGPDELLITFDEPQRAVTPGQSVVLYDGDTVIGGGVIQPSHQ